MKFFKEKKGIIISFIIGMILAGGIVYAAVTSANEVSYTTEKNAEIKNVEDALNDLYNKTGYEWEDISGEVSITANNQTYNEYKLYKCGNVIKLQLNGYFGGGTTEKNIGNILNSKYYPKTNVVIRGCGSENYVALVYAYTDGRITVKQGVSSGDWITGEITWICNNS